MRIVFSASGQVLGRSDYLPFGETLTQSGALPRQRFTGQERDGEAGLDYFLARSLQARTGRMNAPAPLFVGSLTNSEGWNRYVYVLSNPLTLEDPTGLCVQKPGHFCSGVTVTLPNSGNVEYPPEQMSDAAMEGSADLIVGGVNATFGGENLGGSGGMRVDQTRPKNPPSNASSPVIVVPPPGPVITAPPPNSTQPGTTGTSSTGSSDKTVFLGASFGAYLFGWGHGWGRSVDGRQGFRRDVSGGGGVGWGAGANALQGGMIVGDRDVFRGVCMESSVITPWGTGSVYTTDAGNTVGASAAWG